MMLDNCNLIISFSSFLFFLCSFTAVSRSSASVRAVDLFLFS